MEKEQDKVKREGEKKERHARNKIPKDSVIAV